MSKFRSRLSLASSKSDLPSISSSSSDNAKSSEGLPAVSVGLTVLYPEDVDNEAALVE